MRALGFVNRFGRGVIRAQDALRIPGDLGLSHVEAVRDCYNDFQSLAAKIIQSA